MKAMRVFLLAAFVPLVAMAASNTVTYQGVLKQPTNIPVANGVYAMDFTIWDAATAGNQLWSESHPAVAVTEGAFAVPLGATSALGTMFADHNALWLQIAVDTGSGLEVFDPRVPFTGVGYTRMAEHAVNADTATEALHATNVDTAPTAGHATNADSAPTAGHATNANSATSATNATNAGNADTLDGLHAAAFAPVSHNHAGESITSGTVSTDRYSAYADLTAEGRIGTASTQVAAGNHNHANLPYFLGYAGPETSGTKSLTTASALGITNTGTGLVAPVTGRYLVHFRQLIATTNAFYLNLNLNGSGLAVGYFRGSMQEDMIVTRLVQMNAGDTISFSISAGPVTQCWGYPHTTVTMHLVG